MQAETKSDFQKILASGCRAPDIPESADAYGWLIGSWDLAVRHYAGVDVAQRGMEGEAHFAWVLDGRAVQDLWIMPKRSQRTANLGKTMNMYGTTLRVWDAAIQAWRITWSNPAGDHYEQQIGRWSGPDVVQIGTRFNGTPTRWRFTKITAASFHWLGEALEADGETWKLEGEFMARRVH